MVKRTRDIDLSQLHATKKTKKNIIIIHFKKQGSVSLTLHEKALLSLQRDQSFLGTFVGFLSAWSTKKISRSFLLVLYAIRVGKLVPPGGG